ncbi:hypothetical protein NQ315_003719 [Exocentrus adspersus]|uniref:Transformer-like protein A n=1 Tax=Exocentrus adspersus TaxID=1586481 RepID=A0AAV8V6A1_9CUCU|nr:hypothetical protein NQ315_003719 [Exocentrus adspersus]
MEQYTDYLITKTKIITDHSKDNTEEQTLPLTGVDISIVKTESANDVERPHSSISHYSNHSSNSWNKKDRSRYDKSKSYENEVELRRDYKHENRHTYSEQYDRSPRGRKRYTDSEDDYRHSRDKRKWRDVEDKKEGQVLTQQELLAKQRDAKRRRIKYKSVHTGRNKSHTEIMREVIANQMEQYTDYLITKTKIITDHSKDNTEEQTLPLTGVDISIVKTESANDVERPHSSISHYSNHSSNSWNKKDRSRYDKSKSYENEIELRRDYKHENRHTYSEQYDRSPRGRKRYTDSEDDYRHSRDKRKWRQGNCNVYCVNLTIEYRVFQDDRQLDFFSDISVSHRYVDQNIFGMGSEIRGSESIHRLLKLNQ